MGQTDTINGYSYRKGLGTFVPGPLCLPNLRIGACHLRIAVLNLRMAGSTLRIAAPNLCIMRPKLQIVAPNLRSGPHPYFKSRKLFKMTRIVLPSWPMTPNGRSII